MDFIVTRFLRALDHDYHFQYTISSHTNNKISIIIVGIPNRLKAVLKRVTIMIDDGMEEHRDSHGDVISTTVKQYKQNVCSTVQLPDGNNGLCISFTPELYGRQVNALDYALRRYHEKNPTMTATYGYSI